MRPSPIVFKKELEEQLRREAERGKLCKSKTQRAVKPAPVNVGILDLRWFYRDRKTFVSFSNELKDASSSFFASDFMMCIMNQFWAKHQWEIIWKFMIPFVIYLFSTAFYFQMQLVDDDMGMNDGWTRHRITTKVLGVISLILLVVLLYFEVKQFLKEDSKVNYFINLWNLIDIVGIVLTLTFNIDTMAELGDISVENLRIIASVASCCLFMKLYDWLRLFKDTSFYVLLVKLTLTDVTAFFILFAVSLLIFGVPMSMLSLNRQDDSIVSESFGFWLLDAVYGQYMIALG